MTKQTITAFFDSREYANNAALMLRQAGVPDNDVTVSPEALASGDTTPVATGFWASLENMFGGSDDHETYAEGLRRGGIMVTAHVDDPKVDDAVAILEQHGSVDLDERQSAWRSEGWSGGPTVETGGGPLSDGAGPIRGMTAPAAAASIAAPAPAAAASVTAPAPVVTPVRATGTVEAGRQAAVAPARSGQDDVLQVVEEMLAVGKRAVSRGKVRLHSYMVETPVSEAVTLRDETVSIDRRPVDRAVSAADLGADAFANRTVEVEEIDEEAVVAKSVRVVEEIGIRKAVTDRVETVNDTVRSTKVDVEDERLTGGVQAGGFAGSVVKDMEVVGSDGQHVGIVDHVDGPMIKLKKMDPSSGGQHHLVPMAWIQSVAAKVVLKTSAADVKSRWTAAG